MEIQSDVIRFVANAPGIKGLKNEITTKWKFAMWWLKYIHQ
jgi:hypothetical protein